MNRRLTLPIDHRAAPQARRYLQVLQAEAQEALEGPELRMPAKRSECRDGLRPCPWVRCKAHLATDVDPKTGALKINWPELEEMRETCAEDISDRGGVPLKVVARALNCTREAVRQIEVRALRKIRKAAPQFYGKAEK